MTEIRNLYGASPIDGETQAIVRHIISRLDQADTWDAERKWAVDNGKLGDPAYAKYADVGNRPEVPDDWRSQLAAAGFEIASSKNYRSSLDENGNPEGGYSQWVLQSTTEPNTIVRIVVGTDSEGGGGNVFSGADGAINSDLVAGRGPNMENFLAEYANETASLLKQYRGKQIVDVTESLGATTVALGQRMAESAGANYQSYDYNGRSLSAANGAAVNQWVNDPTSAFALIAGADALNMLGSQPIRFTDDGRIDLPQSARAYSLQMNEDIVGNSVPKYAGSEVMYISMPVSLAQFLAEQLISHPELGDQSSVVKAIVSDYYTRAHVSDTLDTRQLSDFWGHYPKDNLTRVQQNTDISLFPSESSFANALPGTESSVQKSLSGTLMALQVASVLNQVLGHVASMTFQQKLDQINGDLLEIRTVMQGIASNIPLNLLPGPLPLMQLNANAQQASASAVNSQLVHNSTVGTPAPPTPSGGSGGYVDPPLPTPQPPTPLGPTVDFSKPEEASRRNAEETKRMIDAVHAPVDAACNLADSKPHAAPTKQRQKQSAAVPRVTQSVSAKLLHQAIPYYNPKGSNPFVPMSYNPDDSGSVGTSATTTSAAIASSALVTSDVATAAAAIQSYSDSFALPSAALMLPVTTSSVDASGNTVTKTQYAPLYYVDPTTGRASAVVNAVGVPTDTGALINFDNSGDGVVDGTDASYWISTVPIGNGKTAILPQLGISSIDLASGSVTFSDGAAISLPFSAMISSDQFLAWYQSEAQTQYKTFFPPDIGSQPPIVCPGQLPFLPPGSGGGLPGVPDIYVPTSNGGAISLPDAGIAGVNPSGAGATATGADGSTVALPTAGQVQDQIDSEVAVAAAEVGEQTGLNDPDQCGGLPSDGQQFAKRLDANYSYDPLTLDLNGDGVRLTGLSDGKQFDLEDTGFAQTTSWVSSEDAFLVVDPTNAPITSGSQLFGQNTSLPDGSLASSGFSALAALASGQSVGRGYIDASDPLFDSIRLLKGDGQLLTLQDAGIVRLNLAFNNSSVVDANNNRILDIGSFVRADGTVGTMSDVGLNHDSAIAAPTTLAAESEQVLALPNVQAMGAVTTLHQAMMLDKTGTLQSLVQQFLSESDPMVRDSLLDGIMSAWAGLGNQTYTPYWDHDHNISVDGEHKAVVEKILGRTITATYSPVVISIEGIYQTYKEYLWAALMFQGPLASYAGMVSMFPDPSLDGVQVDASQLTAALQDEIGFDFNAGSQHLADVYRMLVDLKLADNPSVASLYQTFSSNPLLKQAMDGAGKSAFALPTATLSDANIIQLQNQTNKYIDLNGTTNIYAGIGDVLKFDRGDGNIVIGLNQAYGDDTIVFGADISESDVSFSSSSLYDLLVSLKGSNDSIDLPYEYHSSDFDTNFSRIDTFQFADGTRLSANDILDRLETDASANQDIVQSQNALSSTIKANGNDTIYASNNGDVIIGGAGNESLNGGAGDDTIYAGAGNDIITTRGGNDYVVSGNGNSTVLRYVSTTLRHISSRI